MTKTKLFTVHTPDADYIGIPAYNAEGARRAIYYRLMCRVPLWSITAEEEVRG